MKPSFTKLRAKIMILHFAFINHHKKTEDTRYTPNVPSNTQMKT